MMEAILFTYNEFYSRFLLDESNKGMTIFSRYRRERYLYFLEFTLYK